MSCRSKIASDCRDAPKSLASAKRCRVGLHTWDFGAMTDDVSMFRCFMNTLNVNWIDSQNSTDQSISAYISHVKKNDVVNPSRSSSLLCLLHSFNGKFKLLFPQFWSDMKWQIDMKLIWNWYNIQAKRWLICRPIDIFGLSEGSKAQCRVNAAGAQGADQEALPEPCELQHPKKAEAHGVQDAKPLQPFFKKTQNKLWKKKHKTKTHQKFTQRDITRQIQGLHIEKESWKCQWRSSTLMKRSVFNRKKHHSLVLGLFHWILWRHRLEHQIKCMLSKSPGVHHHLIAEGEWRPHLQNLLLVSTSHNSLQNVWKKSQRSSKDVMAQQKCAALHPAVWTRQL